MPTKEEKEAELQKKLLAEVNKSIEEYSKERWTSKLFNPVFAWLSIKFFIVSLGFFLMAYFSNNQEFPITATDPFSLFLVLFAAGTFTICILILFIEPYLIMFDKIDNKYFRPKIDNHIKSSKSSTQK